MYEMERVFIDDYQGGFSGYLKHSPDDYRMCLCAQYLAGWWAEHLQSKPRLDNGDRSENGFMAHGMASIGQDRMRPLAEKEIDRFRILLRDKIIDQLRSGEHTVCLASDYGPGGHLADVAEEVGIDALLFRFPWKTSTQCEVNMVRIGAGYRAPWVTHLDLRTPNEKLWEIEHRILSEWRGAQNALRYQDKKSNYDWSDAVQRHMTLAIELQAEAERMREVVR